MLDVLEFAVLLPELVLLLDVVLLPELVLPWVADEPVVEAAEFIVVDWLVLLAAVELVEIDDATALTRTVVDALDVLDLADVAPVLVDMPVVELVLLDLEEVLLALLVLVAEVLLELAVLVLVLVLVPSESRYEVLPSAWIISMLSKLPVSSVYLYDSAGFVLLIVTDLTYMVKGPSEKSVSPPAHSMVPAALPAAPPAQLPSLSFIGVCGKLVPSLASA